MVSVSLRVLVYFEAGAWVAQGLEVDVTAFGSSVDEAISVFHEELKRNALVMAELEGQVRAPGPAPASFFQLWNRGERRAVEARASVPPAYQISEVRVAS